MCYQCNTGKTPAVQSASQPQPWGPFVHVLMDFIQMPKRLRSTYILVILDVFSRWVEAYPTGRSDPITVAKILLQDLVAGLGVTERLSIDNGPHFTGQVIKELLQASQCKQDFSCPDHTQSTGTVERHKRYLEKQTC